MDLVLQQAEFRRMSENDRAEYIHRFQQWSEAFEAFIATGQRISKFNDREIRAIALLDVFKRCIEVNIKFIRRSSTRNLMLWEDILWDDFMDDFSEIVKSAGLAAGLTGDNSPVGQPQFHLEVSVQSALASVVARCRDPFIRQKALALMQMEHNQEGFWDIPMAAGVLRRLVTLEEKGRIVRSCKDIPIETRTRIVNAQLSAPGERKATIWFHSRQHNWAEVVEW